ncbi:MAG: type I glutamate--ammonia ligase [Euryarchaeota archaeon]|nr:type I glutamate--ammonia ligase [Euryarchaeota archaeon]MDE1836303.1 type I glutamate--ammonia ligase [Euryarchaeota archaeon]MDE1879101.1 type I glutamate--ammonia ligase [Euryarchaeota archaeon]MDE2044301.1 type I glutamate--ammonia ligase [Thermoplasmata archaeon]
MASTTVPAGATAETIIDKLKAEEVRWLDLQFVDLTGLLQHVTTPANMLEARHFSEGIPKLDGSSIRGFTDIHESDMRLEPQTKTLRALPWYNPPHKTYRMVCNIWEGYRHERFSRDPRYAAERAEQQAKDQGFDISFWGPELEFFIFDKVQIDPSPLGTTQPGSGNGYKIESSEAPWTSGGFNLLPFPLKGGYYAAPPRDGLADLRNEICFMLEDYFGIKVEAHHHEVATAGQCEVNIRFAPLVDMADNIMTMKMVIKRVAQQYNKVATFMPKPLFGDNGSGMHTHQSLWKDGHNTFYDASEPYAEVSQTCRYYIGGLMEHSRALTAITNPTTNSYRRLVPGYEAPVFIAWARGNRSANCRVPVYEKTVEKAKRVEFRTPDPSCNIYLALAAMQAAGLDGVKRKIDPGNPVDEDIYHLTKHRRTELGVRELPGSLNEALDSLESDHDFLSSVFPKDLFEHYYTLKRREALEVSLRPTPLEFSMYLDA